MKLRNYLGLFMAMQTFKLQNSPILKNRSLNFVHLDMRATVENYATSQWGVGVMLVFFAWQWNLTNFKNHQLQNKRI